MNNLAYGTQQQQKVVPQVEEKLRKEVGSPSPIAYQVQDSGTAATSVGTVLSDVAHSLVGGHANTLFTITFDLSTPHPAKLQVNVDRQGVGCHVGMLLYSAKLSNPVKGEVTLEGPKFLGSCKFTGDAETAAKLNAKGDLLKRLGKLARTESEIGGMTLKQERMVKVTPHEQGSLVMLSTLPRPTSMGMDATLDAKEFLELVRLIEKAL